MVTSKLTRLLGVALYSSASVVTLCSSKWLGLSLSTSLPSHHKWVTRGDLCVDWLGLRLECPLLCWLAGNSIESCVRSGRLLVLVTDRVSPSWMLPSEGHYLREGDSIWSKTSCMISCRSNRRKTPLGGCRVGRMPGISIEIEISPSRLGHPTAVNGGSFQAGDLLTT